MTANPSIMLSISAGTTPLEVRLWDSSQNGLASIDIGPFPASFTISGRREDVDRFICELLAAWTAAAGEALEALLDEAEGGEG